MSAGSLLVLNAGSSSIKCAVFRTGDHALHEHLRMVLSGIGSAAPVLRWRDAEGGGEEAMDSRDACDHAHAFDLMLSGLRRWPDLAPVTAAGHRVVHGAEQFAQPVQIDGPTLQAITALQALAPLHQAAGIAGVHAVSRRWPGLPQFACFDTAFHRELPAVEHTYALPAALRRQGLRRYGFHGLSCESSVLALAKLLPDLAGRRVIVAHLGGGTSLTAIHDHRSLATTMGFSTLEGPPMSSRCGSLDPGILLHLLRDGLSPAALEELLYHESGLRALSGGSGDMQTLLAREAADPAAAFAIACYVYRVQREVGSLTAALGGLDVLVFTGGIGEHSAGIRARIVHGLQWLGLTLDEQANRAGTAIITTASSPVVGTVIAADEELVIARAAAALLAGPLRP